MTVLTVKSQLTYSVHTASVMTLLQKVMIVSDKMSHIIAIQRNTGSTSELGDLAMVFFYF